MQSIQKNLLPVGNVGETDQGAILAVFLYIDAKGSGTLLPA